MRMRERGGGQAPKAHRSELQLLVQDGAPILEKSSEVLSALGSAWPRPRFAEAWGISPRTKCWESVAEESRG